jgi:hypothetical protein
LKINKVERFFSALLLCIILLTAQTAWGNYFKVEPATQHQPPQQAVNSLDGLPIPALKAGINAYEWALKNNIVGNTHVLSIVDFDLPSYEPRLWVIDLHNNHVILHIHVAQGHNSGKIYATHFSNADNSHESSLGIYTTTGNEFNGEFGRSIHLRGWEEGINSNAFERGILIHSEWYVTPHFIHQMGYAGRTWGCFAVNPDHIQRLIELTQGGSVLFAYAKQEENDPLVNHHLSYAGKTLYENILGINSNPVTRFFETI